MISSLTYNQMSQGANSASFFADLLPSPFEQRVHDQGVLSVDFVIVRGKRIIKVIHHDGWEVLDDINIGNISRQSYHIESSPIHILQVFGYEHGLGAALVSCAEKDVIKISSIDGVYSEHVIRTTREVVRIIGNNNFLCVVCEKQIQLFSIDSNFQETFSIQTTGTAAVLGSRWIAFNVPCQQSLSTSNQQQSLFSKINIWETSQKAFDNIFLRVSNSSESPSLQASLQQNSADAINDLRNGIVGVRDLLTGCVVGQYESHKDLIELLQFDPTGVFLVSSSGLGHVVLVHKATAEASGHCKFSFTHVFTLKRGITPASLFGISVSLNCSDVVVCSAKGTLHWFRPNFESNDGDGSAVEITSNGRIKLGAPLNSEDINPVASFDSSGDLHVVSMIGNKTTYSMTSEYKIDVKNAAQTIFRKDIHTPDSSSEGVSGFQHFSEKIGTESCIPSSRLDCSPLDVPIAWKSPLLAINKDEISMDKIMNSRSVIPADYAEFCARKSLKFDYAEVTLASDTLLRNHFEDFIEL